MKLKKILITGASGYLGRNLYKYLLKKNYFIYCLSQKKIKNRKKLKWIKGNLKSNVFDRIKNVDIIIHCAAQGVYKKKDKRIIFQTNYFDSLNFLKKALIAKCYNWIIIGSSGEYGYLKKGPMSLRTPLRPINDYGKSKVKLFIKLKNNKIFRTAKIIYLRLFHIYGNDEPNKRLYPSLIKSIKNNINLKMSDGSEIRDFIHVDNVVKKISFCLTKFDKYKKSFITKHLASGKKKTIKDFITEKHKSLNGKNKILFNKIKRKKEYFSMYSHKNSLL
jgi:UDP-glucose 4-epimerase